MAIIRAQVTLAAVSGLAEDNVVNTFHFNGQATDLIAGGLADALVNFYDVAPGANLDLASKLSPRLSRVALANSIKFYDITNGPGGTPYHDVTWTLDAAGNSSPVPEEVALCLSFKGAPQPGANEARRRGRIYTGPFNFNALGGSTISRPDSALINGLLDSAEALADAADALNAPWVVYSGANNNTVNIDTVWVDNAWDTQRRRGAAASSRTTRAV